MTVSSIWTARGPDLSGAVAGRVAVITGAGSGIGRALARQAAARDMRLLLIDAVRGGLDETAAGLPSSAIVDVVTADVRDAQALQAAADSLPEAPQLVFANAGVLGRHDLSDQPAADIQRILDINVMGVVNTVQAFAPAMLAAGSPSRMVLTGSQSSFVNFPGLGAYGASKHAVLAIAQCLAEEWRDKPVSVALLAPGGVATPILGPSGGVNPQAMMQAEQAAALAFAGALDGRFLISTHDNLRSSLREQGRDMAAALG